jgi:seryl-tRNA synthetase
VLDIKQLRADPEAVARNLARRGFMFDVDAFQKLEQARKEIVVASDKLRAEHNANAKAVGICESQGAGRHSTDGEGQSART